MLQISQGKMHIFRCTTDRSTWLPIGDRGLYVQSHVCPSSPASYLFLVHQLTALLHASFRLSLTV